MAVEDGGVEEGISSPVLPIRKRLRVILMNGTSQTLICVRHRNKLLSVVSDGNQNTLMFNQLKNIRPVC